MQYLARLPAGANNLVNPCLPAYGGLILSNVVSIFAENGKTFFILTGRAGGLIMI